MNFRVSPSYYKLEIEDMDCSEVKRINGLRVLSNDSTRIRDFHDKTFSTEIEIVRPFTDFGFFDWLSGNKYSDQALKKTGLLSFMTPEGDPIVSFKLEGLFPTEWHSPDLERAMNWGHLEPLEHIRLAVEKISRV
ncbi:MAG: hypothetical protein ACLFTB_00590 [Desulfovibrionales bacterium]